jgi:peptidoglycan hydrolase-like protein with peptidoglycan-binding domain
VSLQLTLPVLAQGAKDQPGHHQSVHDIQGIMVAAGEANKIAQLIGLSIDGSFGPITKAAVERAQQLWGFTGSQVDGVWGGNTWTRSLTY